MTTPTLPPNASRYAAVAGAAQAIAYSRAYQTDAARLAQLREVLTSHGLGNPYWCTDNADASQTTPATLVVSDWRTRCTRCGRGADPTETAHRTAPPRSAEGCGAVFEQIAVAADANTLTEQRVPHMRPDLVFAGWWPR